MVDSSLRRRAQDLLAELAELPDRLPQDESVVSAELTADLEFRVAGVMLERGNLERAEQLFSSAGNAATVDQGRQRALADQWVRLARAWRSAGDQPRAEAALLRATAFGSASALAALAQSLQREHRSTEAIARWREAIQLAPREMTAYLNLGRLYEQIGDPEAALATYLELSAAAPSLANCLIAAERIELLAPRLPEPLPNQRVRIALLGNATLDHLQSYLSLDCYRVGLRPVFYQAGFDQYTQDILDPNSGLYAFNPDVVVGAIHSSRVFPQLHDYPFDLSVAERQAEIEVGLGELQHLLDTLTAHSSAMVLLNNMVVPQYPALGILDSRDELGQSAAFAEINTRLAAMARSRYRNVYIVDEERVQARRGKAGATDPRLWLTARMGWSEGVLASLSREYLRYLRAARGLNRKCIVVDLDNTLWGGVIGEDGIAGIELGSEAPGNAFVALQRELEKLWRRGVLLAICSKNNLDDVLPVFDRHPEMVLKLSHFAAQRINWLPKASGIREIALELNIGLDSLVFLDDNPVERAAVRAELPQVLVPELPVDPADYRRSLLEIADVFDTLALTDEDRNRNKLYAEQRIRQEAQAELQASGSLDDYLADLKMVVEIDPANDVNLPRIAQLTGKTNQFNLTTRRYTEAELSDRQALGWKVFSARVRDRFGDNGLTGVVIAEPTLDGAWLIDTLLLSCRVMGRGVESALLGQLADTARSAGAHHLRGWYLPTPKNDVVRTCYADRGFQLVEEHADGRALWELDLTDSTVEVPAWLTVRTPAEV